MADEQQDGKCKNPLWVPEGSIRAILAIILTSGLLYLAIDTRTNESIGAVIAVSTWVLKTYFDTRGEGK